MTQNANISGFCENPNLSTGFCMLFNFVITFDPNKVQTHLAPQNDRHNLSFVKDIVVVGKTMTRSVLKTAIHHLQILGITL